MDDARRNTVTVVAAVLLAGSLTWVLTGPGALTSAERIAPAVGMVAVAIVLLIWAWRRPHGTEGGHPMAPPPPDGGNTYNSGGGDQYIANVDKVEPGGIAQQVNITRGPEEPQLRVTPLESDRGEGPYLSSWRLDIVPPLAHLPVLVVVAKSPTAQMVHLRPSGGTVRDFIHGRLPGDDGTEVPFAQVSAPEFPVTVTVHTADPGEDIQLEFGAQRVFR